MPTLSCTELRLFISCIRRLIAPLKFAIASIAMLAILTAPNVHAQLTQSVKKIKFEVVSIRPTAPEADPQNGGGGGPFSDGYRLKFLPLWSLIFNAYFPQSDRTPDPIKNAPSWIHDRFDVEAKVAPEDVAEWSNKTLSSAQKNEMVQGALQAMLADLLKLVVHRESVEVDGYALVVSKHGSRMKEVTTDVPASSQVMRMGDGATAAFTPTEGRRGYWTFYQTTLPQLRQFLQNSIFKPVEDRTGLTGKYHFDLKFHQFGPDDHPAEDNSESADLEALGLELKPTKVKSYVLVIDHMEKPSEN